MKKRIVVSFLSLVLLTTLACNLPAAVGAQVEMQPVHLEAPGVKLQFSYAGNCTANQPVTLDIKSDGDAHLSTTGTAFMDFYNCIKKPDWREDWDIDGTADPDTQVVTFTSCNQGGYRAEGQVSYAGDKLVGKVSCIYIKGDYAGKVDIILTVGGG